MDAMLRLLRGARGEVLSRELGVEVHRACHHSATEVASVRARDNAGPLPGGTQLEEHRIARARAEGVDKPEERFADESLRVIPDEQ